MSDGHYGMTYSEIGKCINVPNAPSGAGILAVTADVTGEGYPDLIAGKQNENLQLLSNTNGMHF